MKTSINQKLGMLFCAGALLCTAAAKADFNFHLDLNVASLIGNLNGPFSLDFQLTDGSGTGAGVNTVTLSNFVLTSGSPSGSPTLLGTASGNLGSTITLSDGTNQFNEFYQGFSSSTQKISFDVSMTTKTESTPDVFSVAILDKNTLNIPTTAPDTSDTLMELPISSSSLTMANVSKYSSTAPDAGVTVAAVPEPGTLGMIVLGFAALMVLGKKVRSVKAAR